MIIILLLIKLNNLFLDNILVLLFEIIGFLMNLAGSIDKILSEFFNFFILETQFIPPSQLKK